MSDPKLFETDDPDSEDVNVNDDQQVYDKMMETPGMEMGFQVTREDPDPTKTFSAESLVTLRDNMALWVGSRIMRTVKNGWGPRNPAPKKLQVHLLVSLDGKTSERLDITPFFSWPDGEHREKAKR